LIAESRAEARTEEKDQMSTKKIVSHKKVPSLLAAQVSDREWAVVSDGRKALTENEANQIIAAYMAVNELLKSTL
jgi:hypothetical protein